MNFKKFSTSDNQWHDVPYYQHKTATDTLTLPAVIYPNDTSITVGVKGQSSQSSVPSPSQPCDVLGCGERTGNLFDISQVVTNTQVINQGSSLKVMLPSTTTGVTAAVPNTLQDYCPTLNIGDEVTLSFETTGSTKYIYLLGENITWSSGQSKTITATMLSSVIIWYASGVNTEAVISNIMLNTGSTALPYEPYGYKIPISCGGTTNNVYLGEVQTTRLVKKLVFNGTESWSFFESVNVWQFYIGDVGLGGVVKSSALSNIVPYGATPDDRQYYEYGCYLVTGGSGVAFQMRGAKDTFTDVTAWKTYLQQQYAAGTPVTIWYILATPKTAVVNEPLRKIGDYADSLTTSIPCTAGENTLDVQTTVQPSEVTATFEGWHPVSAAHERENGQWD